MSLARGRALAVLGALYGLLTGATSVWGPTAQAASVAYCGPQTEGGACEAGMQAKVFLNNAMNTLSATGNVGANNVGIPTVTITSDTNTTLNMLFDAAGGFATITPAHGNASFGGITLTIQPGYAYTELNFDVQLTPNGLNGTQLPFTIQDALNGGLIVPIGNMSDVADTDKEFSVVLTGGLATSTNIFSTFGFDEIKHIEVGGVCQLLSNGSCQPVSLPEPPATVIVFGLGALALGLLKASRRA